MHFERVKVSLQKCAPRAGGSATFPKTELPCRRNAHFFMKIEKHFPGGQKTRFRARRPPLFGSERTKSNMSLRTRSMVHDATLQMQKRTKVAYVCHFRVFQDRSKSPIPRIIHRQNGGGYGGGKARLVWTSRAKRLFLKMSADIEKSRT